MKESRLHIFANLRPEVLLGAVPNLDLERALKHKYRSYPIDENSATFTEDLVWLDDYGVAGQAYWSRPNAALAEPVDGFLSRLQVRRTIAEKLRDINGLLATGDYIEFFGGTVELYVEDATRNPKTQRELHDITFVNHIQARNPDWSQEEVLARRDQLIAYPPDPTDGPAPHMTGAAIDVVLRHKQASPMYVEGAFLNFLREDGDTGDSCNPDYAEYATRGVRYDEADWQQGTLNRRIFYNLMNSAGFQVNPTEYWHWSFGDQMWALLKNRPAALYGYLPSSVLD